MRCVPDDTRLCLINFDTVCEQGSFVSFPQLVDNWYTVRDGIPPDKLMRVLSAIAGNDRGKSEPARKMTDGRGLRLVV
jgi:hypothetical protein